MLENIIVIANRADNVGKAPLSKNLEALKHIARQGKLNLSRKRDWDICVNRLKNTFELN